MAARIEPLLTIADLDAMPEDGNHYEIIEGKLFVSRAPSLTHQTIVLNLSAEIRGLLLENLLGRVYPGPGVLFSDFSGVIPDIIYISNERLDKIASNDRVTGAPDLVIEVLSPGAENERRDRQAKRQLYAKYGVKEYWIVDPLKATIQIYRLPKLGWQQHSRRRTKSPLHCYLASGAGFPESFSSKCAYL